MGDFERCWTANLPAAVQSQFSRPNECNVLGKCSGNVERVFACCAHAAVVVDQLGSKAPEDAIEKVLAGFDSSSTEANKLKARGMRHALDLPQKTALT